MGRVLNGIICLVCTVLGVTLAFATDKEILVALEEVLGAEPRVVLGGLLGGIGYLVGATFHYEFNRWLEDFLPAVKVRDIIWGATGAIGGMITANLAILPMLVVLNLGHVAETLSGSSVGRVLLPVCLVLLPASLNMMLGYLGAVFLLRKQNELNALLLGTREQDLLDLPRSRRFLLDTSAVIDGRVLELVRVGVIAGTLVVPRFVLDELQLLGDSSDEAKRGRGQRGLDLLDEAKRESKISLVFPEVDFQDTQQVDDKLLRYARSEPCVLVTNDYNLSKLAGLEGIETVSLHAIADVMRPPALPGEVLRVEVVKPGKEKSQGVGYLADGSMVVVRDAGDRLGEEIAVEVERVLQTSAGRMLFAHLRVDSVPPRLRSVAGDD